MKRSILTTEDQSKVIDSLRIPITVLVIASHCIITLRARPLPFELSAGNIFLMLEQSLMACGSIAVAFFSLISGYFLFYRHRSYTVRDYATTLKKRAKSLLLPYVLWNFIAIALLWSKNYIGLRFNLPIAFNEVEYHTLTENSLLELQLMPIDHPLWYIREIIKLMLLALPLSWIVRKKGLGIMFIVAMLILSLVPTLRGYLPSLSISLPFVIGAFLGWHKLNLLHLASRLSTLAYCTGWGYVCYRIGGGGDRSANLCRVYPPTVVGYLSDQSGDTRLSHKTVGVYEVG